VKRAAAGLIYLAAFLLPPFSGGADELAVYRANGPDAKLFDQYDNDGYSLAVSPRSDGGLDLTVRVSDGPLASRAPFPTGAARDADILPSPARDAFARTLAGDATSQADAVERVLVGMASYLRYDPDRSRLQDPASVFASRRAHCVGFAELAVDLLRRVGIPARTVQGILRTKPGTEGHDASIGGVYHRWIEIYYPDRGFVFSDPFSSINAVDARYVPFGRRAFARPRDLTVTAVEASGTLDFPVRRLPDATLRVRPAAR